MATQACLPFLNAAEGLGRERGTRHRNAVLRRLTAALYIASKKAYAMSLALNLTTFNVARNHLKTNVQHQAYTSQGLTGAAAHIKDRHWYNANSGTKTSHFSKNLSDFWRLKMNQNAHPSRGQRPMSSN
jgi:hypothetical protein